jgi:hypothetical protein
LTVVGHAVDGGANCFLDRADGAFDFWGVIFGGAYVEMNVGEKILELVIFAISVDGGYGEPTFFVRLDVGHDAGANGPFEAVSDRLARHNRHFRFGAW